MTEPRTPNPLLEALGRLLEQALARIVALDPEAAAALAPLEGRAIELTWSGPELGMRMRVENGAIRVGPPEAGAKPDLSMRGPLAGFAKLAFPGSIGKLATGKVEMSGDAELAREIGKLATKFAPDFDAPFTKALGPAAGTLVARALRQAFDFARGAGEGFARDAALYVREESRDTIAREELEDFLDGVDRVRDDAERLAARIAALAKRGGA
jgi:ubiquinone biosynthesis protein UbiJ